MYSTLRNRIKEIYEETFFKVRVNEETSGQIRTEDGVR